MPMADPAPMAPEGLSNQVAFGAGCYWGTEKFIKKDFQKKVPNSIKDAKVGFMSPQSNPRVKNPTYREVCSGRSGHVEILMVELNDPEKHFEELVRFFFQFHDPTTENRQGNDKGFQYASYIFCGDEAQLEIANRVVKELQTLIDQGKVKRYEKKTITTKVSPMKEFTQAQAEHQEYLAKNPQGYCNHFIRIKNWPKL